MKCVYTQILDQLSKNPDLVLATVTRAVGSTPQKPGSSALFNNQGLCYGTVGGGIVEGKVRKIALDAIHTKESGHFQFNLANDISKTEEAICGGQISVLVEAGLNNYLPVFQKIRLSIENRIPGVLITTITGGAGNSVLISRYWMSIDSIPSLPKEYRVNIEPVVGQMIDSGDPSDYRELELSIPGKGPAVLFFLEPLFPPAKLVIAGAGHIGKALAHLGNMLDFEVTIVDDRPEYANSENIPDASHIVVKDIGNAIREFNIQDDTYIVIVTRGHKDDADALRSCIGSESCYTGMIGSKSKIAAMRKKFIENGWATSAQWDKIYAPVGLDIKSQTVEEIAMSIAAQLVLVRNSRKSGEKS